MGGYEKGFAYHLDDEVIRRYREKPAALKLEWLYMGNVLRKSYPKSIIARHDRLRNGMRSGTLNKGL